MRAICTFGKIDHMNDIIRRIKKFFIRLLVLVRKKMRSIEAKLDEVQPHPILGGFVVLAGVVILVGGLAMMVLPGPGVLALALGIALVIIGYKIFRGEYGPDRIKREQAEKRKRLRRKRREEKKAAKQAAKQAKAGSSDTDETAELPAPTER